MVEATLKPEESKLNLSSKLDFRFPGQRVEGEKPGERLEKRWVKEIVPATVDEEVEAIDGDQVRERILVVNSAQGSNLHRSTHSNPLI